MSRLGEIVLLALNRFAPPLQRAVVDAKQDRHRFSEWEYSRAADIVETYRPELHLRGRRLLDLGSGFGGKLVHYQELAPAAIVSVDIELPHSRQARAFVRSRGLQPDVVFVTADGAWLPFPDGAFDVVISNETFEHVQQPLPALREVARVVRPGGRAFISFPPYYAPWGAHLNDRIALPWVQLFFSERTLLNVSGRLEEQLALNRDLMPEARIDFSRCDAIPGINKITLRRFENLLAHTPLRLLRKSFYAPEWRRRPVWHRLAQPLTRLPGLREALTSHAVYVLEA